MLFVDLDGTLCDNLWRKKYMPEGEDTKDNSKWVEFNSLCEYDTPMVHMVNLLKVIEMNICQDIVYVTGRGEQARTETENWIKQYLHADKETGILLIMRPENEHRSNAEFKYEVFKNFDIKETDFFFEDNPDIIQMIRENFGGIIISPQTRCAAVVAGV